MTAVIRILVNGAFGHMGRLSVATLKQYPEFDVVAECGRGDDLARQLQRHRPDVVLDLTRADVAHTNLEIILKHRCRPIIGTSGLSQELVAPAMAWCKQEGLGGIVAPNFSIAAVLMMRFAAQAAAYFPSAEIIEMHHPAKADAPSGTAIKTAELLMANGQFHAPRSEPKARGEIVGGVAVHSIRLAGVLARQQVLLGNSGETLSLEAHTTDRQAYMPGVVLSCRKVMALTELVYGLDALL